MEIVYVEDIRIAKGGRWYSLRDCFVATVGRFHPFVNGCGVSKGEKWYLLKESLPLPPPFTIDRPFIWFQYDPEPVSTMVRAEDSWRVD
jgi:hypothetical protein